MYADGRSRSAAGGDQPGLVGGDDQLGPVPQAQLGQDPADVGLGGRRAHHQPAGDLGVGQPPRDQHQHPAVPPGERAPQPRVPPAHRPPGGENRPPVPRGPRGQPRRARNPPPTGGVSAATPPPPPPPPPPRGGGGRPGPRQPG